MAGWRPWRALRERDHLTLEWARLDGCRGHITELGDGRRLIVLDHRLGRVDRNAVLAHELIHDERGILFTDDTPPGIVRKEEALVDAETARRLVPVDELEPLVRARVLDGGCVEWRDVAEWFDVPQDVAERGLWLLEQRARRRHPAG